MERYIFLRDKNGDWQRFQYHGFRCLKRQMKHLFQARNIRLGKEIYIGNNARLNNNVTLLADSEVEEGAEVPEFAIVGEGKVWYKSCIFEHERTAATA